MTTVGDRQLCERREVHPADLQDVADYELVGRPVRWLCPVVDVTIDGRDCVGVADTEIDCGVHVSGMGISQETQYSALAAFRATGVDAKTPCSQ